MACESPGAIYSSLICAAKWGLNASSEATEHFHLRESPPQSLTPSTCPPEQPPPGSLSRKTVPPLCSVAVGRLPGSPDLFLPSALPPVGTFGPHCHFHLGPGVLRFGILSPTSSPLPQPLHQTRARGETRRTEYTSKHPRCCGCLESPFHWYYVGQRAVLFIETEQL